MITYKVVEYKKDEEQKCTDRKVVDDFYLITDALDEMFTKVGKGAEHIELYEAETGCKYNLLYTYRKEK